MLKSGNSLAVQRLGLRTLTAECLSSIPGKGGNTPKPRSAAKKKKMFKPLASAHLAIEGTDSNPALPDSRTLAFIATVEMTTHVGMTLLPRRCKRRACPKHPRDPPV